MYEGKFNWLLCVAQTKVFLDIFLYFMSPTSIMIPGGIIVCQINRVLLLHKQMSVDEQWLVIINFINM